MNQFVSRALVSLGCCVVVGIAFAQTPPPASAISPASPAAAQPVTHKTPATAPASEQDKPFYDLGVLLSHNLDSFALSEAEFSLVRQGFADGYHHKPQTATAESSTPRLQALQRERAAGLEVHQKVAGAAYAAKASQAPGARKTDSGLILIPVSAGNGASPSSADTVKVNYEGRLIDGTVFDSSRQHGGQPATFRLNAVIPCWTEAVQLMKVGGKSRIVCPPGLAYAERGAPPRIRPGATLEFDIELLEVMPAAPVAPPAAAGPVAPGAPVAPVAPAPATPGAK
jgi:FKBP-type peptidyl-prolyl cis-trans isomerase FkpA